MGINNSIDNPVAGWAWILTGTAVAGTWLAPKIREVQRELGFWRLFLVKTGSAEEKRLVRIQGEIFAFFGAWLALYLLLDWIF